MELSKLVEFDAVEAGLAALRDKYAGVQFDVTSTEGNKAAREARSTCVSIRTSADKAYQDWNKPMLEKQRAMRNRLAEIKDAVKEVEEPIDAQIKTEEKRKAEEKAERERIEAEKQKAIQDKIDAIKFSPSVCAGQSSTALVGAIHGLTITEITLEGYGDRAGEAEIEKQLALTRLETMLEAAKKQEAEQVKLAAERAELERQRKEQETREAEVRAKAAEEEAKRQAEIEKQQAELRAQQAEIERQRREIEETKAAADKVERDRLAKIETEKQAKAEVEATEIARLEQIQFEEKGPGAHAIIEVLALHYRAHEITVIKWLMNIDFKAAEKELSKELS